MQERFSRKSEAADLKRAFTLLDAKGDGRIDAAELGLIFQKLGHKEKKVCYGFERSFITFEAMHPMLMDTQPCVHPQPVVGD